jgi:hypothetical protein
MLDEEMITKRARLSRGYAPCGSGNERYNPALINVLNAGACGMEESHTAVNVTRALPPIAVHPELLARVLRPELLPARSSLRIDR